jgi:hypothetical protein
MGGGACKNCERWLTAAEMGSPCPVCGSMDRIIFGVDGGIGTEREAVARGLANKHYEIESGLTQVYWITSASEAESSPEEPIKLLEVNRDTIESGVMPLHFGPAPASGIPYPSIIIEVTPNEFEKIQSHQLKLPHGWEIWEQIPKPSNDNGDA